MVGGGTRLTRNVVVYSVNRCPFFFQEYLQLDLSRQRITEWERLTAELRALLEQEPATMTASFHGDVEER